MGVFDGYVNKVYKSQYEVEILISEIHGGVPAHPKVAEGWIRSKYLDRDDQVRQLVAEAMEGRGLDPADTPIDSSAMDEVIGDIINKKLLSGFYRRDGQLVIPGRYVKAMLKESANIAFGANKRGWGGTQKSTKSWFPEHVFVPEKWIPLGATEPDEIVQRFVHTWRGSSIAYNEVLHEAKAKFTVMSDHTFTKDEWGKLWVTAQNIGIGAVRSQGFGTFEVTDWRKLKNN